MATAIPQKTGTEVLTPSDLRVPVEEQGTVKVDPSKGETGFQTVSIDSFLDLWDLLDKRLRFATDTANTLRVLGGRDDVESYEWVFTTAQTNVTLVGGVPGQHIRVTEAEATTDSDGTTNVHCRIFFSSTGTLPTITNNSTAGARGCILSHSDLPPGSGIIVGTGAAVIASSLAGESIVITCDAATAGALRVVLRYYREAS